MSVNIKQIEVPLSGSLFWKRVKLEEIAENSIDQVLNLIAAVTDEGSSGSVETAEQMLSDYYYGIVNSISDHVLPFWWEDFFNMENELKSLVSQLVIYANNVNFVDNRTPFENLLKQEILILKDIKKFFNGMALSKKEISALKESIHALEKGYSAALMGAISSVESPSENSLFFLVMNVFEKINCINERIQDSLDKIALGVAV